MIEKGRQLLLLKTVNR